MPIFEHKHRIGRCRKNRQGHTDEIIEVTARHMDTVTAGKHLCQRVLRSGFADGTRHADNGGIGAHAVVVRQKAELHQGLRR